MIQQLRLAFREDKTLSEEYLRKPFFFLLCVYSMNLFALDPRGNENLSSMMDLNTLGSNFGCEGL